MKAEFTTIPKIIEDEITEVEVKQVSLEPTDRFLLFKQKFIDNGFSLDISFTEKNMDLYREFLNSGRNIDELGYFPKPLVLCTIIFKEGNEKIASSYGDAPLSFTAPYRAAETIALTRLFDRLDIESYVAQQEVDLVESLDEQVSSNEHGINLVSSTEFPVDLTEIPVRESTSKDKIETPNVDISTKSESATPLDSGDLVDTTDVTEPLVNSENDQTLEAMNVGQNELLIDDNTNEPVSAERVSDDLKSNKLSESDELNAKLALVNTDSEVNNAGELPETKTVNANEDKSPDGHSLDLAINNSTQVSDPISLFPKDVPAPLAKKIQAKLELTHGNDWINHIPKSKSDAYSICGITL